MTSPAEVFLKHKFGILQFSGGKDSVACLYYLKEYWNKLKIMWLNTGDAYPELQKSVYEIMKEVTDAGGEFIEVNSDVKECINKHGFPTDLLPAENTGVGIFLNNDNNRVLLQSRYDCCGRNMWFPLHEAALRLNPTLIIRGIRKEEYHKPPTNKFDDGIEYWYPIYDWAEEYLVKYLTDIDKLPYNYKYTSTSLDCMHCTAYWNELEKGKLKYLKKYHLDVFLEVQKRLQYMINTSIKDLMLLKDLNNG